MSDFLYDQPQIQEDRAAPKEPAPARTGSSIPTRRGWGVRSAVSRSAATANGAEHAPPPPGLRPLLQTSPRPRKTEQMFRMQNRRMLRMWIGRVCGSPGEAKDDGS